VTAAARLERFFELSLVLMIAAGFAGVATGGGADIVSGCLLAGTLAYRMIRAFRPALPTLSRRDGTIIAFAILLFYPADIFFLSAEFVAPTIRLLCLFTALQLMMARAGRDYFFLGLLGFLHLLSASMYTAGLGFLCLLLLFQMLATSTYATYEVLNGGRGGAKTIDTRGGRRAVRYLPVFGAFLGVGILALSAVLFAVLPRARGSGAYSLRGDYSVGFSQQVDLGLTGSLAANPRPVMRVEPLDGSSVEGLHWRGITLPEFDGVRWTGEPSRSVRTLRPQQGGYAMRGVSRRDGEGHMIHYRVVLDELPTDVIFVPGEPERITGSFPVLLRSDGGAFRVPDRPLRGLRYEATSWLVDRELVQPTDVIELFSPRFREDYLQLPKLDPRIAALATEVTAGSTDWLDSARRIERYFQTNYRYSLELPAERAEDPLAHFLFERREGHCEYFASSMGVMLRTLGIPSRLVGGFAGGVANPLTGMQILRSSDAHAWVDAYIPGYGWLEFDPSPAKPAQAGGRLSQFWMYWDALQTGWIEWVVDYDVNRQAEIAAGVQERSQSAVLSVAVGWEQVGKLFQGWFEGVGAQGVNWADWRRTLPVLGPLGAAAAFLLLALWLRPLASRLLRRRRLQRGSGSEDDIRYFFERALTVLEKRGMKREAHLTGEEIAKRLDHPALITGFRRVLGCYNAARFGADRRAKASLPQIVREFEAAAR
jgi:transglutaminase-like putative cysteine protease